MIDHQSYWRDTSGCHPDQNTSDVVSTVAGDSMIEGSVGCVEPLAGDQYEVKRAERAVEHVETAVEDFADLFKARFRNVFLVEQDKYAQWRDGQRCHEIAQSCAR